MEIGVASGWTKGEGMATADCMGVVGLQQHPAHAYAV